MIAALHGLVAIVVATTICAVTGNAAGAATVKRLTIRFHGAGVTLTVPASWHVSATRPSKDCNCSAEFQPVCVVSHGDYDHNPYNCQLVIGGGPHQQVPDQPVPGWRLPACKNWLTASEDDVTLGNTAADWRVFGDRCHHRTSEQWTSVTTPSIGIWHPFLDRASDEAAETAAHSARVLGSLVDGVANDLGFVRGIRMINGHAVVRLDHVVATLGGRLMNRRPTTIGYRLLTPADPSGARSCARLVYTCTAAELIAQFRKGLRPADGSRPLDGRLVRVSILPGEHTMRIFGGRRERFVSVGD